MLQCVLHSLSCCLLTMSVQYYSNSSHRIMGRAGIYLYYFNVALLYSHIVEVVYLPKAEGTYIRLHYTCAIPCLSLD